MSRSRRMSESASYMSEPRSYVPLLEQFVSYRCSRTAHMPFYMKTNIAQSDVRPPHDLLLKPWTTRMDSTQPRWLEGFVSRNIHLLRFYIQEELPGRSRPAILDD
jgi:hypothetical protein